jgi:hypothetical protein
VTIHILWLLPAFGIGVVVGFLLFAAAKRGD